MTPKETIFICYRRSDIEGYAGRLDDSLTAYFGDGRVFRDVGSIPGGEDFVRKIDHSIREASVVIVLIGPNWLSTGGNDRPRLHEAGDHVAAEIKAALDQKRLIIPLLLHGARMPLEEELPEELKDLARRNAVSIDDANWNSDVTRLAKILAMDVAGSVAERRLNMFQLGALSLLAIPMIIAGVLFAVHSSMSADAVLLTGNSLKSTDSANLFVGDFAVSIPHAVLLGSDFDSLVNPVRSVMSADSAVLFVGKSPIPLGEAVSLVVNGPSADRAALLVPDSVISAGRPNQQIGERAWLAVNTLGIVCIIVVFVGLAATASWFHPSKRRFVWAAVVVGFIGGLGTVIHYSFIAQTSSRQYIALGEIVVVITLMLVLISLSTFKATDSLR